MHTRRSLPVLANNPTRQDPEEAARDFRDRIRNYEKVYQTIDESEKHLTYVKIINIGYAAQIQHFARSPLTKLPGNE